ncbi:metallophosphoesterase family protein [Patulibacter minatonensis]|uniref:metallophosphoesterase family protein n=1 Tax=Patulibacter minatonensis TaxID=298163 RepID=UPI00047924D3|nr:metallophosphoesterase [Patulibacter minatonensis]
MRIAAIADLHGHLPETPECDVLVIAGDLVPFPLVHDPPGQAAWLHATFRPWLAERPAGRIVGIAGNHDDVFEDGPVRPPELPWTYLQDSGCAIDGVRFWGVPWTPWFFDWAFNAPRGDADEAFLTERFARVPDDTDVLVVHGPPRGYGDRTTGGDRVGSTAQLDCIDRVAPKACIFGHIHEDRGAWTRGTTRLLNVAAVDADRAPVADAAVVLDVAAAG